MKKLFIILLTCIAIGLSGCSTATEPYDFDNPNLEGFGNIDQTFTPQQLLEFHPYARAFFVDEFDPNSQKVMSYIVVSQSILFHEALPDGVFTKIDYIWEDGYLTNVCFIDPFGNSDADTRYREEDTTNIAQKLTKLYGEPEQLGEYEYLWTIDNGEIHVFDSNVDITLNPPVE